MQSFNHYNLNLYDTINAYFLQIKFQLISMILTITNTDMNSLVILT